MPAKRSAGLLLHRLVDGAPEVLLGHMGGPFYIRKDAGGWSIPKGAPEGDESLLDAARREFAEELGSPAPAGEYEELGEITQAGGKVVTAWAVRADFDVAAVVSAMFELEWPRGSGVVRAYPEFDRAAWFSVEQARAKVVAGQREFLDRLLAALAAGPPPTD